MSPRDRVVSLAAVHGSYRAVALAVGISHSEAHRIAMGRVLSPADDVLDRIGLKRVEVYVPSRPVGNPHKHYSECDEQVGGECNCEDVRRSFGLYPAGTVA